MRLIELSLCMLLLSGCGVLDHSSVSPLNKPEQQIAEEAVPSSDAKFAANHAPVVVQTRPVDLTSGMPRRLTRDRQGTPYPLVKEGFVYQDQYPWLRLQFDSGRPGRLLAVSEPSLMPTKVKRSSIIEPAPPSQLCATAAIAAPLDAGPRQNWVTRRTYQLAGNLWRSLFGDDESERGPGVGVVPDPLANLPKQRFVPYSEADPLMLDISGRLLASGLLINVHLVEARAEPTFHFIYLEHRNCRRAWPDRYQVYQLWEEEERRQPESGAERVAHKDQKHLVLGRFVAATLDLSLTESAGEDDIGPLGGYQRNLLGQAPEPIWKQLGFDRPQQGVKALGSGFSAVTAGALGDGTVLVVHIARPLDTRYVTDALLFRVRANEDGILSFMRL